MRDHYSLLCNQGHFVADGGFGRAGTKNVHLGLLNDGPKLQRGEVTDLLSNFETACRGGVGSGGLIGGTIIHGRCVGSRAQAQGGQSQSSEERGAAPCLPWRISGGSGSGVGGGEDHLAPTL